MESSQCFGLSHFLNIVSKSSCVILPGMLLKYRQLEAFTQILFTDYVST